MSALRVYWYKTEANFGDAFSPLAVERCFGCRVSHGGKWSADLVAEGSVLDFALLRDLPSAPLASAARALRIALNRRLRRPLAVWGSGMLFPQDRSKRLLPIRRPRFLAVRGELTRREVVACGLLDPKADLALGDPGVFMPEVLGVAPAPAIARGLVLHAHQWADGTADAVRREHPEIRLVDPRRPPAEVVAEIAGCREVFSSSLHGLVAADALGIPNRWVALETRFADARRNRFKFDDYYSCFGERREPCALAEVSSARVADPVDGARVEQVRRALREVARDWSQKGGRA